MDISGSDHPQYRLLRTSRDPSFACDARARPRSDSLSLALSLARARPRSTRLALALQQVRRSRLRRALAAREACEHYGRWGGLQLIQVPPKWWITQAQPGQIVTRILTVDPIIPGVGTSRNVPSAVLGRQIQHSGIWPLPSYLPLPVEAKPN